MIPINIWGDREVTVGEHVVTEKKFAAALKVQYTPTLIFFNEGKKAVFRMNGYYFPEKFDVVLDYVGMHNETEVAFQDYLAAVSPRPATGRLYKEIATVKTHDDLSGSLNPGHHLLVFFEQKQCVGCDELHQDILTRPESMIELKKFDTALVDMWSEKKLIKPNGEISTPRKWAKELDIKYAPSLVYFDDKGKEVFRSDAYLKSFHVQSIMDYISSGSYKTQPNLQRFIDARADHLREQGIVVDLMD